MCENVHNKDQRLIQNATEQLKWSFLQKYPLTIFAESPIFDVQPGFQYASGDFMKASVDVIYQSILSISEARFIWKKCTFS